MLYLFSQSYSNQKLKLNDIVSLHNQFITNILTKKKFTSLLTLTHGYQKKCSYSIFIQKPK